MTEEVTNLEDSLPMVNYIMLHRIYDALMLIANNMASTDDQKNKINEMISLHEQGYLLGPVPAFNAGENNE